MLKADEKTQKGAGMKKLHKKWIIPVLSLVAAACLATGTYAYFSHTSESGNQHISAEITDGGRVNVSSFEQLFSYSKAEAYNDPDKTSAVGKRMTLTLQNDITLLSDLIVTADCHIDLNAKKLYLAGHSLTISHSYAGSFVISNGAIVPDALSASSDSSEENAFGKIYADVPYADVIFDRVTFENNAGASYTDAESEAFKQVLSVDKKLVSYNAYRLVSDILVNEGDARPERLDYDGVTAEAVLIVGDGSASPYVFDSSLFLQKRLFCHGKNANGAEDVCAFVFRDLDLPTHYLGYGNVRIFYTSSDAELVSPNGRVDISKLSVGKEDVTLTAEILIDETPVASCEFLLHIVDKTNAAAARAAGETLLKSYLQKYYSETAVGGVAWTGYLFNRELFLPSQMEDLGITFAYSAYKSENGTGERLNYADNFSDVENTDKIKFQPTVDIKSLKITLTSLAAGAEYAFVLPTRCGDTELINTNASIARDIVSELYGGRITINPILDELKETVIGYTSQPLYRLTDEYIQTVTDAKKKEQLEKIRQKYGNVTLDYELMNNTFGVYEIVGADNLLKVADGKKPEDYVQSVILDVQVTFSGAGGSTERIQLEVAYAPPAGGDNISGFLPYYTYYNDMLYSTIGGYTVESFTMPFCYGSNGPIVCYDITGDTNGAVSLKLTYGDVEQTFSLEGYGSCTSAFNQYLGTGDAAKTKLREIIDSGDAKWNFVIDKNKIPRQNSTIKLVYNYIYSFNELAYGADSRLVWTQYAKDGEPIVSSFTLAGVLKYAPTATESSETIRDENLYKWIYDNFNVSNDVYTMGQYTTKFVYTDWLKQNVTFDISDATLQKVTNFYGLQYLVGTKKADFTGKNLSGSEAAAVTGYLSQMTALETLILSRNGFTDRANAASEDNGILSGLAELPSLKTLYIDNNNVYSFEWLLSFPSLSEVYVYQNNASGGDGIFYGSAGLANLPVFQELTDNGVSVYNTIADANPILFEKSDEVNDYINLKGVEYQSKLKKGVSIADLYKNFSTTLGDYGIERSYKTAEGTTYSASNQTLTWGHIGDPYTSDTFTLTYSLTLNGTSVKIVIKFHVTRI